ncbi:MAG TPA: alanine racemase [Labilithrix sp.]|jgi:D-serine deaminase-like pyridoxal phosphate-dependent protein
MPSADLADWSRYRRAIRGETMPLALVDLDALEANVAHLVRAADGKPIRLATKSVRAPALMRHIVDAANGAIHGVMAFSGLECPALRAAGFEDIVVAYPTVQPAELDAIVHANASGARAALVVDCEEHVDAIAAVSRDADVRVPIIVDVDVALRPFAGLHIGVRRSPLREASDVVALAARVAARRELQFDGIMAYEAHVAGVPDDSIAVRAMKRLARRRVESARSAIVSALRASGLSPRLVNGGGTGSVRANAAEKTLTEITVGSGFLASHLFDRYDGLALRPAAFFAVAVSRRPEARIVTCAGGGWIASGPPSKDRSPRPWLPPGLELIGLEGAGEVQTPLRVPSGIELAIGEPVLFRHAKAGELAEHVREILLVRGDAIVGRSLTYRGLDHG